MQEKHAKLLTGCGIGCAAVVALVVVVAVGAFFAVRNVVKDFEQVNETVSSVSKKYGETRDYTPDPDGRIPAERVEAFLAVRNRTRPVRDEFRQAINDLEAAHAKGQRAGSGFRTLRSALGLPRLVSRLYSERASALLDQQMGFGEYLYIYSVAYYSLLKKDPGDGPQGLTMADNHTIKIEDHDGSETKVEHHRSAAIAQVHSLFTGILRNVLEPGSAMTPEAPAEGAPEAPLGKANLEWRQAVQKELDALDAKWSRIPWEDGLPKQLEESLAPFRAELEASYDPTMNLLEFAQSH